MSSVKVRVKVIEDNTGIKSEIPVLLTEQGELSSVTDYILKLEAEGVSASLINSVLQAISLLLDYMEANKNLFNDPEILFQTFAKRLYSGTIGEDGIDPSGLYWIPTSTKNIDRHIQRLTDFTDWLSKKQGTVQLNPLREATSHERRLNYAAWFRKNQNDYLGHIEDKSINQTIRRARTLKGRTPLSRVENDALAFPQNYWVKFYKEGIGGAKDPRVAIRDKLILLLMHGGGLRESEALSLWVTDVFEDIDDPDTAVVRIYNEVEGKAPYGWHSRKGISTRKAYLKEQYGRIPRIKMNGTARLGWKNRISDHQDNYIRVQWFPTDYGKLFMLLWKNYQKYRASVECHHPYAFISFHHKAFGNPYTLNAFHQSYATGLKRINLAPNKSKGLDPHGHRHSYGRRLEQAKLNPLVIRRCLHHKSLDSQLPYTTKSEQEVSNALNQATQQLANPDFKVQELEWEKLTEYTFEDIDPYGYFTGKHPKLRGK
ncbi:site-specific integrase [Acinetobacter variabilis]|uniref:gamma-mobile-trio recombinase GmtY n=1 Tax=Acinetobacter variabilis TaxID=70346 RepID=UPI001ABC8BB5|nr:gamma-mobile-trio recombinase GmtY [Acinetobacter variabilis]MBO3661713.1 site-specific integrase [Acinetobacter variabilis]MCU4312618.1 site-specific integrase [Acinetobacter variabilis]